MDGTIILQRRSTRLEIARPDVAEPYYRGTRFDRTGNILALEARGHRYVSRWFRTYDPYRHDAVGGPAEEFTQIGHEEAAPGEGFLKIGVGLLAREAEPYDRFHLYKVLDPGRTTVRTGASEALFRHVLKGYYDYSKKVSIPADCALRISHRFRNTGPSTMDFHVYSHNFFILDGALTGRATRFFLPFTPEGHWRTDYDSVALVPDSWRRTACMSGASMSAPRRRSGGRLPVHPGEPGQRAPRPGRLRPADGLCGLLVQYGSILHRALYPFHRPPGRNRPVDTRLSLRIRLTAGSGTP